MAANLNKFFAFVSSAKTEEFKTAHVGKTSTDPYYGKICFLAGTSEILTNGQLFGINNAADVSSLRTLVGESLGSGLGKTALNPTDIVDFIEKVYGVTQTNAGNISTNAGDITALETRVGMDDTTGLSSRIKANEDAIDTLNANAQTQGSVDQKIASAIADVVASAPEAFDTLKEIAAWIQGESNNATAFNAASRITALEDKVGVKGQAATTYTAEEAAAYNAELEGALEAGEELTAEEAAAYNTATGGSKSAGDTLTTAEAETYNATLTGAVDEGDTKSEAVTATGIYRDINNIQEQINALGGAGGSIQDAITTNIQTLDSSVTLAGTTSSQPSTVTKTTYIDVLGSITVSETDGKLDAEAIGKSAKVVLQADAAGAAQATYTTLLGDANDASDGTAYTIHGVQNYATALVANKNVSASGDSLVSASASGNAVTVSATQDLSNAVALANSAIQSVTVSSGNVTYITVAGSSGSGSESTAATATVTPVFGSLTVDSTGASVLTYVEGLASTKIVADAINAIDIWETVS